MDCCCPSNSLVFANLRILINFFASLPPTPERLSQFRLCSARQWLSFVISIVLSFAVIIFYIFYFALGRKREPPPVLAHQQHRFSPHWDRINCTLTLVFTLCCESWFIPPVGGNSSLHPPVVIWTPLGSSWEPLVGEGTGGNGWCAGWIAAVLPTHLFSRI